MRKAATRYTKPKKEGGAYEEGTTATRKGKKMKEKKTEPEGCVVLKVSQEQLEEAIAGLQQLKPIITQQVIAGNKKMGSSKEQTEADVKEMTGHFDTAITAMYMLLNEIYEATEH